MVIVVTGASGSGKSSFGQALATTPGRDFSKETTSTRHRTSKKCAAAPHSTTAIAAWISVSLTTPSMRFGT